MLSITQSKHGKNDHLKKYELLSQLLIQAITIVDLFSNIFYMS